MWPLYLTRVVHLDKRFKYATKSQILSFLEDPLRELRLNPLAIAIVQDERNPAWFTITDSLPLFCGLESTTTYRVCSKRVDLENEQGTDNEVWAGMGTRMLCERRIEERVPPKGAKSSQKEVWFREKVVIKAWCLLMPFIYTTMVRGHLDAIDKIDVNAAKRST